MLRALCVWVSAAERGAWRPRVTRRSVPPPARRAPQQPELHGRATRTRAAHRTPAARTSPQPAREKRTRRTRRARRALMQTVTAVAATARSRRRGQAAQTPGTMDPSRCLRLPHSALGAPDAPYRPGWSMTMASRASCRKPRPTHGRQPWPRRRAQGPAAPPALAQHHSIHKA